MVPHCTRKTELCIDKIYKILGEWRSVLFCFWYWNFKRITNHNQTEHTGTDIDFSTLPYFWRWSAVRFQRLTYYYYYMCIVLSIRIIALTGHVFSWDEHVQDEGEGHLHVFDINAKISWTNIIGKEASLTWTYEFSYFQTLKLQLAILYTNCAANTSELNSTCV